MNEISLITYEMNNCGKSKSNEITQESELVITEPHESSKEMTVVEEASKLNSNNNKSDCDDKKERAGLASSSDNLNNKAEELAVLNDLEEHLNKNENSIINEEENLFLTVRVYLLRFYVSSFFKLKWFLSWHV